MFYIIVQVLYAYRPKGVLVEVLYIKLLRLLLQLLTIPTIKEARINEVWLYSFT